ncbi:MAG: hypothetical protein QG657_2454 [Acidobacteriota bacterium]|nr:hypothetical protein [Acidobacteriota bacterium]
MKPLFEIPILTDLDGIHLTSSYRDPDPGTGGTCDKGCENGCRTGCSTGQGVNPTS